jgi:hypothetical protein
MWLSRFAAQSNTRKRRMFADLAEDVPAVPAVVFPFEERKRGAAAGAT